VLGPGVNRSPSHKDLLHHWIGHAAHDDQVGNTTGLNAADKVIETNCSCWIVAYQRYGSR